MCLGDFLIDFPKDDKCQRPNQSDYLRPTAAVSETFKVSYSYPSGTYPCLSYTLDNFRSCLSCKLWSRMPVSTHTSLSIPRFFSSVSLAELLSLRTRRRLTLRSSSLPLSSFCDSGLISLRLFCSSLSSYACPICIAGHKSAVSEAG